MMVWTLDEKQVQFRPQGHPRAKRSGQHAKTHDVFTSAYPTIPILEECSVPIYSHGNKTLFFDLYVPLLTLVIEIQGEQHFAQNSRFHKTPMAFGRQKTNDRLKREFCELNGFTLIYILPEDNEGVIEDKIRSAIDG